MNRENNAIQKLGFYIALVYGFQLAWNLMPFFLDILSRITGSGTVAVEYKNIAWSQEILALIISGGLCISGLRIMKAKKNAMYLFITFVIISITSSVFYMFKQIRYPCPFLVLGIFANILIDVIFVIFLIYLSYKHPR